jgi:hypothetical protein
LVDRKLAGILGISAILSTMLSIALFNPGPRAAVEIAVNSFPEELAWGGYSRPRFVTDLVATRDLPDLVVQYSVLKRVFPDLVTPWNQTESLADPHMNVLLLREVEEWLGTCGEQGLEVRPETHSLVVRVNGSDFQLLVLDYTDAFRVFGAGPAQLNSTDTVWAFFMGRDDSVVTYAGIRDFFFERLRMIYHLEVLGPGAEESYASDKVPPELGGGKPGLDQAPDSGTVHRRDLAEGERLHIAFDIVGERMPRHGGMLQLVSIGAGEVRTILANFMGASAGG